MKAFSKSIIFILILCLSAVSVAHAKDSSVYADKLNELGIIIGTDNGYEPQKTLTRAESTAVLVRLLGMEDTVQSSQYEQKFTDVSHEHWAYKYIMFCYDNSITKGTGSDTFSPDMQIDAEQFITLLLRLMGYNNVSLDKTFDLAVEIQLLNSKTAQKMRDDLSFKRADMFYILYRSLKTQMYNGTLFANHLADGGVISNEQAEEFDIYLDFENIDELIEELLDGVN